jgi:transglycosylase-like protein with SLT domain
MMLLELVLGVMVALTPSQWRPQEGSERSQTYRWIAQDIVMAVENPLGDLPFDGPAAKEASAVLLAAIARNESGYDPRVRNCTRRGDHGRSISVFQLIQGPSRGGYSELEICTNPQLAAKLALEVLGWYKHLGSSLLMLQGYAAGDPSAVSDAATRTYDFFVSQRTANQIKIQSQKGSSLLRAEFVNQEKEMELSAAP